MDGSVFCSSLNTCISIDTTFDYLCALFTFGGVWLLKLKVGFQEKSLPFSSAPQLHSSRSSVLTCFDPSLALRRRATCCATFGATTNATPLAKISWSRWRGEGWTAGVAWRKPWWTLWIRALVSMVFGLLKRQIWDIEVHCAFFFTFFGIPLSTI